MKTKMNPLAPPSKPNLLTKKSRFTEYLTAYIIKKILYIYNILYSKIMIFNISTKSMHISSLICKIKIQNKLRFYHRDRTRINILIKDWIVD